MVSDFIAYIIIYVFKSVLYDVSANINVLDKGVLPIHEESVAIKLFVDIENHSRVRPCRLFSWCKKCCLINTGKKDCDILDVFGGNMVILEPKERRSLFYVYPTVYKHDRTGYCDIALEYNCGWEYSKKSETKVEFDTSVFDRGGRTRLNKNILKNYHKSDHKVKYCESKDNDPFKECSPVNCDLKYGGQKPFYYVREKKCVEAPSCIGQEIDYLPSIIYVPKANTCRDVANPLTHEDIYTIKSGIGVIEDKIDQVIPEDRPVKTNLTTISQNLNFLKGMMYGKYLQADGVAHDYRQNVASAIWSIITCIFAATAMLLAVVCCINTCVWLNKTWSKENATEYWNRFRSKFKKTESNVSTVNKELKNSLLREVIVRDIPIELRDNSVDVTSSIDRVKQKRRFKIEDLDSLEDLEIEIDDTSVSSTESDKNNLS